MTAMSIHPAPEIPLQVTGITANSRPYDGTLITTLNTSAASLQGVASGHIVTLVTAGAQGVFADKNQGLDKVVTINGLTLAGDDAYRYTIIPPTTTATITPKAITANGITANDKVYDGTSMATLNTGGASLEGVVGGDIVTLNTSSAAGHFTAGKNAGANKPVTISGLALAGADAGNYSLTQPTATADITPKHLTVNGITANDKVYDGSATAILVKNGAVLAGAVSGDTVTLDTAAATATFANKNVGANKPVTITGLVLGGADFNNYSLTSPTTAAGITKRALTITATGINKVYDGTTAATVILSDNRVAGDILVLGYTTAAFSNSDIGTDKPITVTGITVTGADAGNYTFNTLAATTADIIEAARIIYLPLIQKPVSP